MEELSDDEIQIIKTCIKTTYISPGIKVEPEDAEVEAAVVTSIMDQPAQTLSWAEQVEEEVSANMVPTQQAHDVEATKAIPMAYKVSPEASETNSKASKVNLEASEMPPPKPPKVAPIFKRPICPMPQDNYLLKKTKI